MSASSSTADSTVSATGVGSAPAVRSVRAVSCCEISSQIGASDCRVREYATVTGSPQSGAGDGSPHIEPAEGANSGGGANGAGAAKKEPGAANRGAGGAGA